MPPDLKSNEFTTFKIARTLNFCTIFSWGLNNNKDIISHEGNIFLRWSNFVNSIRNVCILAFIFPPLLSFVVSVSSLTLELRECEKKMGKESFKKAYAFLKEARFGETTMAGETADEKHIIQGLRQFVDNPSDGFLIDQLLFLEEQAKFMK